MDSYIPIITLTFGKRLKKLKLQPYEQKKVKKYMNDILNNPYSTKVEKMKNPDYKDLYKYKNSDIRILFKINKTAKEIEFYSVFRRESKSYKRK